MATFCSAQIAAKGLGVLGGKLLEEEATPTEKRHNPSVAVSLAKRPEEATRPEKGAKWMV